MTDISTDAKFSYLDITHNLSVNEIIVIDNQRNITCNEIWCNRIKTNDIQSQERSFNLLNIQNPSNSTGKKDILAAMTKHVNTVTKGIVNASKVILNTLSIGETKRR
jgi:hypothetical protein